jgi:hypothetical protein
MSGEPLFPLVVVAVVKRRFPIRTPFSLVPLTQQVHAATRQKVGLALSKCIIRRLHSSIGDSVLRRTNSGDWRMALKINERPGQVTFAELELLFQKVDSDFPVKSNHEIQDWLG